MKMLSLVIAEILIAQAYTRYMRAKSLQSCPTLCNPMDCSPPGSCIHGILQVRILEWVAIPFSRGSPQSRDRTWVSCIEGRLFTVWATRQAFYQVHAKRWKPLLLPKKKYIYIYIYIYIFDFGMSNLSFHPIDPHLFPTYTCTSFYQAKPVFLNSVRLCMV